MVRSKASRLAVTGALLAGALVLSGCSLVAPTGDDRARAVVDSTARGIAAAIDEERPRNVLASEFAYRYSEAGTPDDLSDTTLGSDTTTIEALEWNGMTRDDDGARFVLRISAHLSAHSSNSLGDPGYAEGDATACFAFRVFAFYAWTPTTADAVECPTTPATPPPSPAPTPTLADDASAVLEAVLAAATEQSLAADMRAAFPDDSVRSDRVMGARLIRDSGAEDGVLAAAVGIAGTTDCVVGRKSPDGAVATWHPQDVTLAAGEAGCSILNALHPVTTH
jgi:hypothetical protein